MHHFCPPDYLPGLCPWTLVGHLCPKILGLANFKFFGASPASPSIVEILGTPTMIRAHRDAYHWRGGGRENLFTKNIQHNNSKNAQT